MKYRLQAWSLAKRGEMTGRYPTPEIADLIDREIVWSRENEANLKARAGKLAEAIDRIRTAIDRGLDLTPSIYGAIATLKEYEAAQ